MKKFIKYFFIVMIAITVIGGIAAIFSDGNTSEKSEKTEEKTEINKQPASAYLFAKELIKSQLKSPSTAKFASFINHEAKVAKYENGNYQVILWVDAQNSLGATLRKTYRVDLKPVGDNWDLVEIVELK